MKIVLQRCPLCGRSGVRPATVDRNYRVGGTWRRVRGVPAQVCPHCGEVFLDVAGLRHIDRTLRLGRKRRRARAA